MKYWLTELEIGIINDALNIHLVHCEDLIEIDNNNKHLSVRERLGVDKKIQLIKDLLSLLKKVNYRLTSLNIRIIKDSLYIYLDHCEDLIEIDNNNKHLSVRERLEIDKKIQLAKDLLKSM